MKNRKRQYNPRTNVTWDDASIGPPIPTPPLCRSAALPRSRHGLTFIDLIISIAIIAVLVALLLPAVQQAREAARRTQCKNNLLQLNIALQNYTLAFGTFPPGSVNATGPIQLAPSPDAYHVSWIVQILPQLELKTVQNHFDFNYGIYTKRNLAPQQRTLAVLVCPSNPPPTIVGELGSSDYAGIHASTAVPIDVDNDGILHLNSRVRTADITDGTSYTLLVGEKNDPNIVWGWASGTSDTLRNTGYLMNFTIPLAGMAGMTLPAPEDGLITDYHRDNSGRPPTTWQYMPPPPTDELDPGAIPDPNFVPRGFSSSHTGGAQFAMADGSGRFISENIDAQTFQQLAGRNDGHMPGDF